MTEFKTGKKVRVVRDTTSISGMSVSRGLEGVVSDNPKEEGRVGIAAGTQWYSLPVEDVEVVPSVKDVQAGDEVELTVTVWGIVRESRNGHLEIPLTGQRVITEDNLVAHVPAAPKYKAGQLFEADYGLNEVTALYSPKEDPKLPWVVIFSDGSYGRRPDGSLTNLRPLVRER